MSAFSPSSPVPFPFPRLAASYGQWIAAAVCYSALVHVDTGHAKVVRLETERAGLAGYAKGGVLSVAAVVTLGPVCPWLLSGRTRDAHGIVGIRGLAGLATRVAVFVSERHVTDRADLTVGKFGAAQPGGRAPGWARLAVIAP